MDNTCGNCKYFSGYECRRHAPVIVPSNVAMHRSYERGQYPIVEEDFISCGDFELIIKGMREDI